jgi:hypothetical protein
MRLDTPMTTQEIDEALDASSRKQFLEAIESDSEVADKVIREAQPLATSGLIRGISLSGVGTLTNALERDIVAKLGEARATAPVEAGAVIPMPSGIPGKVKIVFRPGMGAARAKLGLAKETEADHGLEAVTIHRRVADGRVIPRHVSVTIAENEAADVVRRNGAYLVGNVHKVLFRTPSLALALLLFSLLTKKARDKK